MPFKRYTAMEHNQIGKLIEKYYAGETSLAEDARLRELLNHEKHAAYHEHEKDLFEHFEQQKKEADPPEGLQADLLALVENKWKASVQQKLRYSLKWAVTAAACLAIVFISYDLLTPDTPKSMPAPSAEEQQAFLKTKQVLSYVSETINAERSKLSGLTYINKGFSSLHDLSLIDKSIENYKTIKK